MTQAQEAAKWVLNDLQQLLELLDVIEDQSFFERKASLDEWLTASAASLRNLADRLSEVRGQFGEVTVNEVQDELHKGVYDG